MNYWQFFQSEILGLKLENIQKLYEAAHITNAAVSLMIDSNHTERCLFLVMR